MVRFLIIVAIAFAAFWCYNNIDFSNIVDNAKSSIQNEKTIKTVNDKRSFDHEQVEAVMRNE